LICRNRLFLPAIKCWHWKRNRISITKAFYGRQTDRGCLNFLNDSIHKRLKVDITDRLQFKCNGDMTCKPYNHIESLLEGTGYTGDEEEYHFMVEYECKTKAGI